MSGLRQFRTLLRKNVLLKTRRPWATCFELSLPLALFVSLVWARARVDEKFFDTAYYAHNEIYPLANQIMRSLRDDPSLMTSITSGTITSSNQVTTGRQLRAADGLMSVAFKEVRKWAACEDFTAAAANTPLQSVIKGVLDAKVNGKTLGSHFLSANPSDAGSDIRTALDDIMSCNVSKLIEDVDTRRRDYLDSRWPQRLADAAARIDIELSKLRDDLNAVDGAKSVRGRVEGWVGDVCAIRWPDLDCVHKSSCPTMNATRLAQELKSLQKDLNNSGIVDWIRGAQSNSSNMFDHLRNLLGNITADDVADAAKRIGDDLKNKSAASTAEAVDTASWWLSHYVRTRSAVARFLGEMNGNSDMSWTWTTNWPVPQQIQLRTEMAGAIYQGVKQWQNNSNPTMMSNNARSHHASATNWVNGNASSQYDSILSCLNNILDDITNHNVSGIEKLVIPKWNNSWQSNCPFNQTAIGAKVEKTHQGCPFYRSSVRHLAAKNMSAMVSDFHRKLTKWNVSCTLNFLHKWQDSLRQHIQPTKVGDAVQRVWNQTQSRHAQGERPLHDLLIQEVQGELRSGAAWNATSISCPARRLRPQQKRTSKQFDNVFQELLQRKLLVAPYKGESRKLFEYLLVELGLSLTTNNRNSNLESMPRFLESLLRCPIVKALAGYGVDRFINERLLTFDSESAMEKYARDNPKNVLFAVVFRNANPSTGNFDAGSLAVDYAIRAHSQFLPRTSKILRISRKAMFGGADNSSYPYITTYFTHVQESLGRAVARLRAERSLVDLGTYTDVGRNIGAGNLTKKVRSLAMGMEQFPSPAFTEDRFIKLIQNAMPMNMIIGWIYAVCLLVKEMVYEKQEKLRDVMRIQGLKTWVYWASWFASGMVQMIVLSSLTTVILVAGSVIPHSDPLLIYTFYLIYSMATVSLAMLISSFFSRAKVAAACGGIVYWTLYFPFYFFNRFEDVMSESGKNILCLFSSTGMGVGAAIIAKWELIEEGAQWSNVGKPPPVTNSGATPTDNFSLSNVMWMLLIDCVVYQVLAWYIEKVRPGTLGLPQPWYFPCLPSYWRGVKATQSVCMNEDAEVERQGNSKLECWEPPAKHTESVVKMRGLTKTFKGGKQALKGISLDIHKGSILGLLGHNGAGKSTTMAILTGLYPPTDGDVEVNGRSVRKDSHGVREQLGVCLQQNALYENITVEEHLNLFCCLKSVPWNQMRTAVESLLNDTGLLAKRHAESRALSGGMKRKLSIGIALSGGSQVVTLDEPTAGIDATSRRDIWQLLARHRSQRTILLSTHFMDEADILSDRVAIIAEGALTAIGSGMFLKRHFADNYLLTLVALDVDQYERMTRAVTSVVPEAKFMGSRGRELSYSLPAGARHCYASLFDRLQNPSERKFLGIETYGLSAATMEEVFLQASSVHESGLQGKVRNVESPKENHVPLQALQEAPPQLTNTLSEDQSTTSGDASLEHSDSKGSSFNISAPKHSESKEQSTTFDGDSWNRSESKSSSGIHSASHEESTAQVASENVEPMSCIDTELNRSETGSISQSSAALEEKNATIPSEGAHLAVASPPHKEAGPATPLGTGPATPRLDPSALTANVDKNDPAITTLSPQDAQKNSATELFAAPKVHEQDFPAESTRKEEERMTTDVTWESAPQFNATLSGRTLLDGSKLWSQQFVALFRKRALSVRRDRRAWASQLLLPSIFVLIALVCAKILSTKESEPALKLSTDMFIGTTSAGAVTASMSEHIIPFGDVRKDSWGADIFTAFNAVKGSSDVLKAAPSAVNLTHMGSYLLDNHKAMLLETYGAVSTGGLTTNPNVTLWFKTRAYHAVPVMADLFNNARFQMLGYGDTSTTAWNHPLPKSQTLLEEEMTSNSQIFVDLLVAVTMLLAMGFIPASFVVYLVHEKSSSGKHQQLLTGVGPNMYWVASYFFDVVNYLIPCLVCYMIFVIFQVDAYSGRNSFAILVLLFTYGLCMTPCMYFFEPLFKVPSTAYVTLICLNIFTGITTTLSTTVLDMAEKEDAELKHLNRFSKAVFPILFPNFCLGRGMIEIATNHYMNFAYDEFGVCIHTDGSCIKSALAWSAGGKYMFHLMLMAPCWFFLRLLVEHGFCTRRLRQQAKTAAYGESTWGRSEDEDVNEEADRIKARMAAGGGEKSKSGDSLMISELSKSFPRGGSCCSRNNMGTTHAVRGLSVGVPRGECFGLLGVNGAGKTTTMRMITGDTSIDGGDVRVCDWSVHGNRDRARRHLGYCPQFDALPDKLTARETLALYARIRGIPAYAVQSSVDHMIKRMCLESHERTMCEHLSGGNKRKLSTALALIGKPDVVLLDEPSTGVDVGARRFLWDVIDGIRQSGHALVLTSHSMEECEVLCTRLTVMVHGQFRCLGSPMQLKTKYGGGYTLTVKVQQTDDAGIRLKHFVATNIPGAVLVEETVGFFRYDIRFGCRLSRGNEYIPLGHIFSKFECATKQGGDLDGCISDYTLSQTSLEEVFLHFCQEATLETPYVNEPADTPVITDVEEATLETPYPKQLADTPVITDVEEATLETPYPKEPADTPVITDVEATLETPYPKEPADTPVIAYVEEATLEKPYPEEPTDTPVIADVERIEHI